MFSLGKFVDSQVLADIVLHSVWALFLADTGDVERVELENVGSGEGLVALVWPGPALILPFPHPETKKAQPDSLKSPIPETQPTAWGRDFGKSGSLG